MKTYSLDAEFDGYESKAELADDLRAIASQIENDYVGGISCYGTSWGIDTQEVEGDDEDEDDEENDD